MRWIICCFTFWLLGGQYYAVTAQPINIPGNLLAQHITEQQGLSSNNIFKVMQDSRGFIWIITAAGLNRYDGYQFKFYGYNIADSASLLPGRFDGAIDNKTGLIWITASGNQGFYSFNPVTEKFKHYQHHPGNKNTLDGGNLNNSMTIDGQGLIWLTGNSGLNSFDPKTNQFCLYTNTKGDSSTISNNNVTSVEKDSDGNLWVTMNVNNIDKVDCFDPVTKKAIAHFSDNFLPYNTSQPFACNIHAGKNGNLWLATEKNGLYKYNIRSKKTVHFIHRVGDPFSISGGGLYKTLEDHSGNVWICNSRNRLDYFDYASEKFYRGFFPTTPSINNYSVNQIFEDKSGNIWIATVEDGIYTFNPAQKKIHSVFHDKKNKRALSTDVSICILQIQNGQVLLGTNNGVAVLNKKDGSVFPFPIIENGKDISQKKESIWYMYEDKKGVIWLCTINGLLSYDPQTKRHRWYRHNDNDSTSLSALSCTGIIEDSKGRYWVTTWGGGFDSFDPVTGKFHAFKLHDGINSISTNYVANLIESSTGNIYIGSWDGGFIIFNPDKVTFTNYRHHSNDLSTLSNDIVFDCYEAKNGIVWLCTNGGGLNAFDPVNKKFKAFTVKNGLCDNGVTSITADNNGNLWLGTVNGISRFAPPENPFAADCKIKFRNYNVSDGLPANQTYLCSAYKESDGTIYFGTTNKGFFYFQPQQLTDNPFIPPVYITGFDLFNRSVEPGDSTKILSTPIEETKEIKLGYYQNVISFTLTALNYIHPEKNQYAYKLEGFNKDWIYTDAAKRFANYTNLNAGEYTFRVKASNNDGVWNEQGASIKLIITPPYWQTGWFGLLCSLAAVMILYALYYFRMQKLRDIRRIRKKIAGDLHDDLGATLSSISIMSELVNQQIKNQSPQSSSLLEKIGNSSRNMIESVNDMVWAINPQNDSFENIIKRMRAFAAEILGAKDIAFHFDFDKNLIHLKLKMEMRRSFYLIFKESVNNMAKYSNASNAFVVLLNRGNNLKMTIIDDGVGFNLNAVGKGNGLINMQQRAKDMKARFNLESIPGKGTFIELEFKND